MWREMELWRPLLECSHRKVDGWEPKWAEQKKKLIAQLERHPDGKYACDAHLILACGLRACEGRVGEAEERLEAIAERYARSPTIIGPWNHITGYNIDSTWMTTSPLTADLIASLNAGKPIS